MITMQTDGLIKALRGETTIEEVLRVTKRVNDAFFQYSNIQQKTGDKITKGVMEAPINDDRAGTRQANLRPQCRADKKLAVRRHSARSLAAAKSSRMTW